MYGMDGLVMDSGNYIADVMELPQSITKPSIPSSL